jgi:hypothetical protein
MTNSNKPVVLYLGKARIEKWLYNEDIEVAYLDFVVDHPALGSANNVRTSAIVKKDEDGCIETRNTIYKPATISDMEY